MHRATVASLAVAAVLGTTGGIALAVQGSGGDEPGPAADSSAPTDDPSRGGATADPTSDPTSVNGAFYFADGAIHDGDTSVPVPDSIDPVLLIALARVDGGWLLVQSGDDSPTDIATFVATDGDAWRIGGLQGHWDLAPDRSLLYYDTGTAWKQADFARRTASVVDVIGGGDSEPFDFMDLRNRIAGIAYSDEGLLTAWQDDGQVRIVSTDIDRRVQTVLGVGDIALPDSSGDGSVLAGGYDNPDYAPTHPVGGCVTGGRTASASPSGWWQRCEWGTRSTEPFSPDGAALLLGQTVGDGPPGSGLLVVDPVSGAVEHRLDAGGYLLGAVWSDVPGSVNVLVADDGTGLLAINACEVASGTCHEVVQLEGAVVLGTVG